MTTNEQIAKMMGLRPAVNEFTGEKSCGLEDDSRYFSDDDFSTSMSLAKLLQAKMVENGWHIKINQSIREEPNFWCDAISENCAGTYNYRTLGESEPAAIVSLFMKVYGITEE